MLHSYAFSNFRSFRNRVEVDLRLNDKDSVNGWAVHSAESGQRLTTAIAILGPNASGKTSLLHPLVFLGWFIRFSFNAPPDALLPIASHFTAPDLPSEFEVVADLWGKETILRYKLEATQKRVLRESLEAKVRRGQWKMIFDRRHLADDKYAVFQEGFGLDAAQAVSVRPNVSLISWAAQFGVEFAKKLADFSLDSNLRAGGGLWRPADDLVTQFYGRNDPMRKRMVDILARWDLGLNDVEIREFEIPSTSDESKKQWYAFGVHRDSSNNKMHRLPFGQESSGTKTAFSILALVLPILESGGVIVLDELDGSLHPHMIEPLLELFASSRENPNNAQIIFTCHSVEVLRFLQKSQVVLVEKDGLTSEAWRLDSMDEVRSDENRVAKYLAGAYGAVPRL
jgi:uncharacterized protein